MAANLSSFEYFFLLGMAYAMLATLPPVHGLYCSMCASFVYFFLGTSRHLSLGSLAIISLLVGGCLDRNLSQPGILTNVTTSGLATSLSSDDANNVANRIVLASALAMVVGIIQLMMGTLHLGFLTRLLSQPMIAGFTFGSSVYVGISQLFVVFGLHIKKHTGLFNAPLNLYNICANLSNTNWATFGLSLSCMAILYAFQLAINPPLRKRIRVPVPIELLIIVFGGIVSHYLQLEALYQVHVVGTVPIGFPAAQVPRLSVAAAVLGDAFVIAIIGFSLSYSLAFFYAHKEGFEVDANQELMAYGITNISGSFFTTFPVGASISRTALVATMGGKSQVVGLIASILVLFVVLFAGPLFYKVPNCCLSAIILVALRGMLAQLLELPTLWHYSVWDLSSWLVTFAATACLDVLYGLIIGIAFSVLTVFIRTQCSKAFVLGRFDGTEVFKPLDEYTACTEDPKLKVIRYEGGLFYAGVDRFASSVIDVAGFNPRPTALSKRKLESVQKEVDAILTSNVSKRDSELFCQEDIELPSMTPEVSPSEVGLRARSSCSWCCGDCRHSTSLCEAMSKKRATLDQLSRLLAAVPLTHIVLDCSGWTFIDLVGASTLQALMSDYDEVGVKVYLASPSRAIHASLIRFGLFKKFEHSIVFISVYDAYAAVQRDRQQPNAAMTIESIQCNQTDL